MRTLCDDRVTAEEADDPQMNDINKTMTHW